MLVISSWYQIVDMLQTAFTGALRGLRDTKVSMLAFAASLFGISLPLGFWLAHYSPWAEVFNDTRFPSWIRSGLDIVSNRFNSTFYVFTQQKADQRRVISF